MNLFIFRKIPHNLILRDRKSRSLRKEDRANLAYRNSIRHFRDIAGYEGIFISGKNMS